jgi:hypothetical protein
MDHAWFRKGNEFGLYLLLREFADNLSRIATYSNARTTLACANHGYLAEIGRSQAVTLWPLWYVLCSLNLGFGR